MALTVQRLEDRMYDQFIILNPDIEKNDELRDQTREQARAFATAIVEWLDSDVEVDSTTDPAQAFAVNSVIQDS